jgi:hypothetical protein
MADNNMNLNSSPEQELDLDQLEQVSGGMFRIGKGIEEGAKLQPASGGEILAASSGNLQATGGVLKPFPTGGAADNDDSSEGGLSKACPLFGS